MKRFWFIIAAVALTVGMNALNAAPFYKVQCYDANDKLVNCNDVGKVKKHAKKSTKSKIAKAKVKKSDALAQKKARERAIALRLAKQNSELKTEMEALRKANLLAAAKTEEKPAATAQLAAAAPAPAPVVAPTSTTQIAKDVEPAKETSQFAGGLANEVTQGFRSGDQLANELDIWFDYIPTKHITFEIEQDMTWNWTVPAPTTKSPNPDHSFSFADLTLMANYSDIYHTEDKLGQLDGHIKLSFPTTQASRDAGRIVAIEFKGKYKQMINNSKGFFKFEAKAVPVINRYSTSAPSLTSATEDNSSMWTTVNGLPWEKLSPNARFKMGVKTAFSHVLTGPLSFETSIAVDGVYSYADEVVSGGSTQTITPAAWKNTFELTLPKFTYQISSAVKIEAKLVTVTTFDQFKLFNTDSVKYADSAFGAFFKLAYDI
jgi:hypothetical protein